MTKDEIGTSADRDSPEWNLLAQRLPNELARSSGGSRQGLLGCQASLCQRLQIIMKRKACNEPGN